MMVQKPFNKSVDDLISDILKISSFKSVDYRYCQNLYAALCDNDLVQNDSISIIMESTVVVTWRTSSDIVSGLLAPESIYLDFYLSGMIYADESPEAMKAGFVQEGTITDEIRADLLQVGWLIKKGL